MDLGWGNLDAHCRAGRSGSVNASPGRFRRLLGQLIGRNACFASPEQNLWAAEAGTSTCPAQWGQRGNNTAREPCRKGTTQPYHVQCSAEGLHAQTTLHSPGAEQRLLGPIFHPLWVPDEKGQRCSRCPNLVKASPRDPNRRLELRAPQNRGRAFASVGCSVRSSLSHKSQEAGGTAGISSAVESCNPAPDRCLSHPFFVVVIVKKKKKKSLQ